MILTHPNYDPMTGANNIALIYLPVELYYSSNTAVLNMYLKDPEIPSVLTASFIGQTAKVAAWGQTSGTAGTLSNTLKTTDLSIVDSSTCGFTISKFHNAIRQASFPYIKEFMT
jgi:hypothetical protein